MNAHCRHNWQPTKNVPIMYGKDLIQGVEKYRSCSLCDKEEMHIKFFDPMKRIDDKSNVVSLL